jgi:hypothetical protein
MKTLVDEHGRQLIPAIGRDNPLGRSRKVAVLRLRQGPVMVTPSVWLAGPGGERVTDAQGIILGTAAVIVHRLASAMRVTDTRYL